VLTSDIQPAGLMAETRQGVFGRFALVLVAATLIYCLTALLLLVSPAFAEAPSPVGPCPGSGCFAATSPGRIAVEESTGDVYVIDQADQTVNRFTAEGTPVGSPLTAEGISFQPTGGQSCDAVAIDNSSAATKGNVYVVAGNSHALFAFDKAGHFLWKYTASEPCGVAVDPAGNLWLSNYEEGEHLKGLQEINPADGSEITAIPGAGEGGQLDFDSKSDFISLHWNQGLRKLSPAGEFLINYVGGPGQYASAAVDRASDRVYAILDAGGAVAWTNSGEFLTGGVVTAEPFGPEQSSQIGIAADAKHHPLFISTTTGKVYAFDIAEPHLNASATGSGSGVIACKGEPCKTSYYDGKEVELGATAHEGSHFTGWTVNGNPATCGTTNPCNLKLTADTTVEAGFAGEEHELTVTTAGSGEVHSSPAGISCGATCKATFPAEEFISLTATPAAHNHLVGWKVNGSANPECLASGACQITLSEDTTVEATFAPTIRHLAIATAGTGSGSVTCQVGAGAAGACAPEYQDGTEVTIAASAAGGSTFAGFSGGGCSASPCTVTLSGDTAVTATFNVTPAEKPVEKPLELVKPPTEIIVPPPPPPPHETTKPPVKKPTRAQLLAKALKKCKKLPKHKRPACVKQAEKKYGPKHKAKKK
jgi:hypothetical protein